MVIIDHNALATTLIEHRLKNTMCTLLVCVVLTALMVKSISFSVSSIWAFRRNSQQHIGELFMLFRACSLVSSYSLPSFLWTSRTNWHNQRLNSQGFFAKMNKWEGQSYTFIFLQCSLHSLRLQLVCFPVLAATANCSVSLTSLSFLMAN